jgi:WS/DGAT/MGAT family acyltransferase
VGRQPLSSIDFAWLRMDEPTNLMLINGVLTLAAPLAIERLRQVIVERLLPIERFRQRVVKFGGDSRWEIAPDFELDRHVFAVTLPDPGGDSELTEVVNPLLGEPLDPSRPLWEFRLIHNYLGGSVLMGRIHHAVGDGMALMLVLLSLTDRHPDARTAVPYVDPAALEQVVDLPQGNPFTRIFQQERPDIAGIRTEAEQLMPEGMKLLLAPNEAFRAHRFLTALSSAASFVRLVARWPDPKTAFKGPLGVAKKAAWSQPLRVADVKALGQALGGTINDVLLTAMAGGLRRYLLARGERVDRVSFRAAMPVNLRGLEEMAALGNRFGLVFLSIPVGIADPIERLAELRRLSKKLRLSTEPVVVYGILRLLGKLPHFIQRLVVAIFATKTTAVMTNVPGPREELFLADVPIRDIFFWVPQSGRVGLGISIFSYNGHVRLGIGTDAVLVPDPERIVDEFHHELEDMQRLARERG